MKIIKKAQKENRNKNNNVYYEEHHILPKSLFPLWQYKKENLVLLTLREHFFCHQLLIKIYPGKKMLTAIFYMMNIQRYIHLIPTRRYERIKLNYQNACSEKSSNSKWYNDGVNEKFIHESEIIPPNFNLGRIKWKANRKQRRTYFGGGNPKAKKIKCITTGETFDCVGDAAKKYGKGIRTGINACCIGGRKHSGKHPITGEKLRWQYI